MHEFTIKYEDALHLRVRVLALTQKKTTNDVIIDAIKAYLDGVEEAARVAENEKAEGPAPSATPDETATSPTMMELLGYDPVHDRHLFGGSDS